jgi:hypothetical protein
MHRAFYIIISTSYQWCSRKSNTCSPLFSMANSKSDKATFLLVLHPEGFILPKNSLMSSSLDDFFCFTFMTSQMQVTCMPKERQTMYQASRGQENASVKYRTTNNRNVPAHKWTMHTHITKQKKPPYLLAGEVCKISLQATKLKELFCVLVLRARPATGERTFTKARILLWWEDYGWSRIWQVFNDENDWRSKISFAAAKIKFRQRETV